MLPNTYRFYSGGKLYHLVALSEAPGWMTPVNNGTRTDYLAILQMDLANGETLLISEWNDNVLPTAKVVDSELLATIEHAGEEIYQSYGVEFHRDEYWVAYQDWQMLNPDNETIFVGTATNLGSKEVQQVLMVTGDQNDASIAHFAQKYPDYLVFGLNSYGEYEIPEETQPVSETYQGQPLTLQYCEVGSTNSALRYTAILIDVSNFAKGTSELVPVIKNRVRDKNNMHVVVSPHEDFGVLHFANGTLGSSLKIYQSLPDRYDDPNYEGWFATLY